MAIRFTEIKDGIPKKSRSTVNTLKQHAEHLKAQSKSLPFGIHKITSGLTIREPGITALVNPEGNAKIHETVEIPDPQNPLETTVYTRVYNLNERARAFLITKLDNHDPVPKVVGIFEFVPGPSPQE